MRKTVMLGFALAGVLGASVAEAQGYPGTGKPRCKSREVFEEGSRSISLGGYCRPKDRDGYRWVADPNGGFFEPLVLRADQTYAHGYAKDGRWVEVGWQTNKPGFVWVEGHYNTDGTWSAGYWEKGRANQEWVQGSWKSGRWQDGSWREIPYDGVCPKDQIYVDEIFLPKLRVPEYCRESSRVGFLWKEDPHGGYWLPTSGRPGYAFVQGHISGEFGAWTGEDWSAVQPDSFFVQGHYSGEGKWVAGEWVKNKRGYTWDAGEYASDGSWTAGQWTYDPAKACARGEIIVEEIKLPKLKIARFCRPASRPGYSWTDDPYGGYWSPIALRPGQVFQRGHVEGGEFGLWTGESLSAGRAGYDWQDGHYNSDGTWTAGEWKELKRGYTWKDGRYNTDGSWVGGELVFDPASACGPRETYVEEVKLAKLFVPRFCRPTTRAGYTWENTGFGGYWKPTAGRPGQVFQQGHIEAEFGTWIPEKWAKVKAGFVWQDGHYDTAGKWIDGEWKSLPTGQIYTPGKYNADGSWVAGVFAPDPSYTPAATCGLVEVRVAAVSKAKLSIPAFCRPAKRKDLNWVENEFGGWWAPDKVPAGQVFIRGHWDSASNAWIGESFAPTQPGKIFVQGHYSGNGSWVEGSWIEEKAGFTFTPGKFNSDGSWVDGTWNKSSGYPGSGGGYPGSGGGRGY